MIQTGGFFLMCDYFYSKLIEADEYKGDDLLQPWLE